MNTTGHGRWGRYRTFDGEKQKLCNGPLHSEEGAWLREQSFWRHKNGKRAGKLMSRCIECEKTARGRHPRTSGFIPVSSVWWIFREIVSRVGKAEGCRLIGISQNMWFRAERGVYRNMRRETARKAIVVLHDLREREVVRHKTSIKHGAAARGRKERVPIDLKDYYYSGTDADTEYRRKRRAEERDKKAKEGS